MILVYILKFIDYQGWLLLVQFSYDLKLMFSMYYNKKIN